ncbi:hypothetical protein [Halostella salina]|uniref:hypothetical protein n=1 Tax=Halostella salina TaxID=1547897 RepID=UPI000EF7F984|nr:hypothetical protein [Halostella salina]
MPAKHTAVRDGTSGSARVHSPSSSLAETVRIVERALAAVAGGTVAVLAAVGVATYLTAFGSIATLVTVVAWAALVAGAFAAPFVAVRAVVAALTR